MAGDSKEQDETRRRTLQEYIFNLEDAHEKAEELAIEHDKLNQYRNHLEKLVKERTADLERTNKQLQQEIIERQQREATLRELEELESSVLRAIPHAVIGLKERFIIFANHGTERVFGWKPEELIGKNTRVLYRTDEEYREYGKIYAILEEQPLNTEEFCCRHKSGKDIVCRVHSARVGENLKDQQIVIVYEDITEWKRAEEEIAKEKEKLQILSDNAPFGMVLTDKEGHFTYINPKFTEVFGFDLSDIPDGRTWFRKAYPNAEYRHTVISGWIEEFRDAKPGARKPRVYTVTCKDRTQKIVSFITSVLVTGDYLMACEDITELKHLESRLGQAQKMEAIGTLTGGIAHDFNNILMAVMGYGALLQKEIDERNPLRPYVDEILSGSQKAAQLTQSLLGFSRQQPVILNPLNLNDIIGGAEKLLKRLVIEDIAVRTILTPDDIVVMADATQIDQVLFNLATNARDAMPRGGALTIETRVVELDDDFRHHHGYGEPGTYALLSISDTGIGMDEATKEKIFDPFFTTKEVGKGTGLGLSSVYGAVKQHNGYIAVYSEPNIGTTFHIYLPVVSGGAKEEEPAPTPVKGGNETILVAEDNEAVRGLLGDVLRHYGYNVIETIDGADAIEKFKKIDTIDLLILDSIMPAKNGREAYDEIRKMRPDIKVLFTSGYTRDVILDKGIEDKKFHFISKPISPKALLQKVRAVLDGEVLQ